MKKRLKRAALYDPYLDTLGGGEKYILSILKVLAEEGFEINIFWDKDLSFEIEKKLSLRFINKLKFLPNIFRKSSPIDKLIVLKDFAYFFYVTDGSYFFSTAKKNFIYAMVPQQNLYQMTFFNRLKTHNCDFITHSKYTQNWLSKWGIKSRLIYPYIDIPQKPTFAETTMSKEKIILSVGRFFKQLHSKRQDLTIKYFQLLKERNPGFNNYKLVLVGGLKKEDERYYNELKETSHNDSTIVFKPNISRNDLNRFYQKAKFYWHFAGFAVDEEKNPELVEHMGIAPLEAMVYGTIPFCFSAGGPKEIIENGKNGFLFNNGNELLQKMGQIIKDRNKQIQIKTTAQNFVKENFSYQSFKDKVIKIIL